MVNLHPFGIFHFPCTYSLPYQRSGFGSCASKLSTHFPLFAKNRFQFIPWTAAIFPNHTLPLSNKTFTIPQLLSIDHSTLDSLNHTYNTLDQDMTYLHTITNDVDSMRRAAQTTATRFSFFFRFFADSL